MRSPTASAHADFRSLLMPAALLALVTVLAYVPALRAGYFWDDSTYVQTNAALRSVAGLWRIWCDPLASPQYYPLVFTTFWLEYHLWGLTPFGYHATNVALHAANAVLVWIVLRRLAVPGALLAGAIFALHPVHVESVAWITERKDVLSGLFYLLSLLAWWRFESGRAWASYAVAFALFVCALLSKTAVCTLPLVVVLLAWWKRPATWQREIPYLLPFLATAGGLSLLTAWRENLLSHADSVAQHLSVAQRLLISGEALWFYLGKLLWPFHLVPIYHRWSVDPTALTPYAFVAGTLAVVALLWLARQRIGLFPFVSVTFFIVTLAPVWCWVPFNFMGISWVADRFQYLASIGIIALLSATLVRAAEAVRARAGSRHAGAAPPWLRAGVAAPLLLVLGVLTWRQAGLYGSAGRLWRATLSENPTAWMAHNNLGTILLEQGRLDEAIGHFQTAQRLMPEFADASNNMGLALARQGKTAAALEEYRAAIHIDPWHPEAHNNLGVLLLRQGQLEEAQRQFEAALQVRPDFAEAHNNLGTTLVRLGRVDAGLREFHAALQANPQYAEAHKNLQATLALRGRR